MSEDLRIKLDVRELVERMEGGAKETENAIRRGVDKSARLARKEAVKKMAADMGVKPADIRPFVPPVKTTRPGNLQAVWTIKRKAFSAFRFGNFTPVVAWNKGRFDMSSGTYRLTQGGSTNLSLPKVFTLAANGGRALMVRYGRGRKDVKAIYGMSTLATMKQSDGAARREWEKTANANLAATLPEGVQVAIDGGHVQPDNTPDD